MQNSVLYIAEGEIEERFIKFLTQNDFIQMGRFRKFNLMQDRLKDNNSILTKKVDKVYCILDTDLVSSENIANLFHNLKKLKEICQSGALNLIQNKNFEDEIRFVLDVKDLGKLFNLKHHSIKDLKTYLAQKINYRCYISKENLARYCSRPEDFKEELLSQKKNTLKIRIVSIDSCFVR